MRGRSASPRAGGIKHDPDWLAAWTHAVIRAVNTPQAHLDDHRRRMKQVRSCSLVVGGRRELGRGCREGWG